MHRLAPAALLLALELALLKLAPSTILAAPASSGLSSQTSTAVQSTASTQEATSTQKLLGPSVFTVPGGFPTKYYQAFFSGFGATQTTVEPQPKITNLVTGQVYPLNLTRPEDTPDHNLVDPVYFPPSVNQTNTTDGIVVAPNNVSSLSTPESRSYADQKLQQIIGIIEGNGTSASSKCSKCTQSLAVAKTVARTAPWEVPYMLISLCERYKYNAYGSCEQNFEANSDGGPITQVLYYADVTGLDGQYICSEFINKSCPFPNATKLDLNSWFEKPKPKNARAPPPSGKTVKVAHLSDFHLDPRYKIGSESNCTEYLCCQYNSNNTASIQQVLAPAPRYGAYKCDTPWDLAGAATQAVPVLAGFNVSDSAFNFTIYTGDLISHLNDNQLSRAYVEYTEDSIYGLLKHYLGGGPIYAALGNHDSWPQALNSQQSLAKNIADEFNWNYDHISALWETLGWISDDVAKVSRAHYGGYSTTTPQGLRIITLNTDFWYRDNYFNYINMTNPDLSGTLRFLTDELQAAEDNGERAYIIGHVISGWSGSNGLPNPTDLFYQIVDRFSPHVIANIFFGHTHEDQLSIFYANNATDTSASTAQALSWIGPSITPLTNLNSGFRVYEVDERTFDVMDAYTFYSNVSAFNELDSQTSNGPAFNFEYSTREAYGGSISWPETAPLNATWWHKVTEAMEQDSSLVSTFNTYQGKTSALTTNCTSAACVEAKICYLRSGSTPIATENCSGKYASVQ